MKIKVMSKLTKAYKVDKDGYYSSIKPVDIDKEDIDNDHTYFKSLSKAKKYLIDDLNWTLNQYKENIKEIRSIKK